MPAAGAHGRRRIAPPRGPARCRRRGPPNAGGPRAVRRALGCSPSREERRQALADLNGITCDSDSTPASTSARTVTPKFAAGRVPRARHQVDRVGVHAVDLRVGLGAHVVQDRPAERIAASDARRRARSGPTRSAPSVSRRQLSGTPSGRQPEEARPTSSRPPGQADQVASDPSRQPPRHRRTTVRRRRTTPAGRGRTRRRSRSQRPLAPRVVEAQGARWGGRRSSPSPVTTSNARRSLAGRGSGPSIQPTTGHCTPTPTSVTGGKEQRGQAVGAVPRPRGATSRRRRPSPTLRVHGALVRPAGRHDDVADEATRSGPCRSPAG